VQGERSLRRQLALRIGDAEEVALLDVRLAGRPLAIGEATGRSTKPGPSGCSSPWISCTSCARTLFVASTLAITRSWSPGFTESLSV